jgi:hypothetical protein
MSITRAQIARQLYAKGGNTGYSDFASPSSTTASQDFATQAVSGGQTDYSGGGGSYDYIPQPPMAQVKTDPIKGGDNIPAWAKHAMTTLAMRGSLNKRPITNYGFQSGADFQLNFPNLDPRVTAVLASGYQLGQEGLRSLNPFGGNFLDFKGAFNTAQESAAKNIEGALAADLNVLSPEEIASGREYAESVGINNNVYINKARGGRVNYAKGGNTGYSDFASPSSTTASQDFATQAVSGGQTDYDGGGSSYDYIPQPTVAKLNTINTSDRGGDTNPYGLRSKFQRGLDKALPYLAGFIGSKLGLYPGYKAYDAAKTNVEKQQEELNRFTNAINTGSFYVPGQTGLPEGLIDKSDSLLGFQNRTPEPTINTGGGDNQIIPRMQMIAEAPSDVESTSSDFDLYAALEGREGMRFGENPYDIRGVTQRFAGGGEVRQAYGLGSLVRKATKAVKKVLKSDIGKAALLYAGGTYLGGMKAFNGSGIGAANKFGFQNFGGRLLNPTGTDGISNFLLNPFGKSVEKGITLEPESVKNFAEKYGMTNSEALKYLTSQQNTPVPGYVKYGIPTAMAATYFLSKKEEPDDLDQEIAQNYTDNSGLKEQLATYKPFRFEVPRTISIILCC